MTIQKAYQHTSQSLQQVYTKGEAQAIARRLLSDKYNISHISIITDSDTLFEQSNELEKDISLLLAYTPIQHILGFEEFMGRNFSVTPKTLIPRPETEELVRLIIDNHLQESTTNSSPITILDIGTGSGAIAITLSKELGNSKVTAIDIDPETLIVATNNATNLNAEIEFIEADILKFSPTKSYDIIVSNPPYVTMEQKKVMHQNVTKHEPDKALYVADNDPLIFYRRIVQLSSVALKRGGSLYFEINEDYGVETADLLVQGGFADIRVIKDFNNKDRIVCGVKN